MTQNTTDPIAVLRTLIQCPSVTPDEGGALSALTDMLSPMGFSIERPVFSDEDTPDIENLYARLSGNGPHLMFAGHTDVVPVGDEAAWTNPPFSAAIKDGMMYGRGAVDMKGGIACFVAALARYVEKNGNPSGSISFLITGDEEGPAINGSKKLLEWAAAKGETWDGCILGEPTNPDTMGDMMKIGRRGSLSGTLRINGTQGHTAYPHLADNPTRSLVSLLDALLYPAFDEGTENFQPSNIEVNMLDVVGGAINVIPAKASAVFNIRFNDTWNVETLKAEIERRLSAAAKDRKLRPTKNNDTVFDIEWREQPSHVFLTRDDALIDTLGKSVEKITGRFPEQSTTGGTSDARFIKDYCPVIEFGLVGQTMHKVDECVAVDDLETLTRVYEQFIGDWFLAATSKAT
ncbi:succinyl-diaminopimelate desuccinylase [Ahrensia kielensis]|uniref:succinyl-diaminopimelate desuccinylase n=1 Tax=Ahrensia kielensis TaxID=76980 RepID=UPI000365EADA|nr:succinyl-diaminopimelate desuccinylase [Ahrensia kielensis]